MGPLADRIALITGASAGIGQATARAFARLGARLIVLARRRERLERLASELAREFQTRTQILAQDLRRREEVAEALGSLPEEWRAVDILVNNAGLARGLGKLHESRAEEWDEVIDVNVRGLLCVSRVVIPWMLARGRGHIVNLGSIAGHEVYPGGAVYCASKHAVRALSLGMKMDLLGTPIRVTSIDPGLVQTEFSLVRFGGDRAKARAPYQGLQPLTPEDVAEAIVFCVLRPDHVNVSSIVLFPTAQASSTQLFRAGA